MRLYFDQTRIPRSVGRSEWRRIQREVRVTRKELAKAEATRIDMLRDPTLPKHLREDLINHLINPPILLGPYQ